MRKKEYQLYDSLWKAIIEEFTESFFYYFFPQLAPHIDFYGIKFLNKELPNLFVEMAGDGRTDVVIEAPTRDGQKFCFIFHVEIQGYYDKLFSERMFMYYYRLRDYYGERILSLAILTDGNRKFHPKRYEYVYPYGENAVMYRFNSFKVINQSDESLYLKGNIFSYVMLAAKKAIIHRKNASEVLMLDLKTLVRQLYAEGFSREQIRKLYNFICLYGTRGNQMLVKQLDEYHSRFNPSSKSMTIEEAVSEYFKQQALKEGMRKGIRKGKREGKIEGMREGKIEGMREGLQKGIEQGMEKKAIQTAEKCLRRGMRIEEIVDLTELPLAVVQEIAERLKQ